MFNPLPVIDTKEYPTAVPGSVNEASILESPTSYPDVWTANAITGRKHQIVAVFNSIYGGKQCSVAAIENPNLKCMDTVTDPNKNSENTLRIS